MFVCVKRNDIAGVRRLLRDGVSVYEAESGLLPLYWALKMGHDECAKLLYDRMSPGDLVSRTTTCICCAYNFNRGDVFDYMLRSQFYLKDLYRLYKLLCGFEYLERIRGEVRRRSVLRMLHQLEQVFCRDIVLLVKAYL
jgi:hypothetical protein